MVEHQQINSVTQWPFNSDTNHDQDYMAFILHSCKEAEMDEAGLQLNENGKKFKILWKAFS